VTFDGARALHRFYLTTWVFLPDPSVARPGHPSLAGSGDRRADRHYIRAPVYLVTISLAMKSVKPCSADRPALRDPPLFSMSAVNQRRGADGELWQPKFFDRALRSVKEYNQKVESIHLKPVRAGHSDILTELAPRPTSAVCPTSGRTTYLQIRIPAPNAVGAKTRCFIQGRVRSP
jgi:hypothetical protein